MVNLTGENVSAIRSCLKDNIANSRIFVGFENERNQLKDLLTSTIECGESNSALLLGARGSGKTTLVNGVLKDLQQSIGRDAVQVRLHGLVHTDDRLALKSITSQMDLENAVDGKVFGSFADNLSFLLACLKSGEKHSSKSVIFVIDEFDLFCSHHNQTLLYNLFDIAQSVQTPICVLGITSRLDVIELLEKRVKSRFSHRQILLFHDDLNGMDLETRMPRLNYFLTIPDKYTQITSTLRKHWNVQVNILLASVTFKGLMERLLNLDISEQTLKTLLFAVVSRLDEDNSKLTPEMFAEELDNFESDDIVLQLRDLSVLEICLLIAMKHHYEIYDQPMNFQMIFTRFSKFSNASSGMQSMSRAVAMKAFEHLEYIELITPVSGTHGNRIQQEYQLYKLQVLPQQIIEAIKKIQGFPTEVTQWANSSLAHF